MARLQFAFRLPIVLVPLAMSYGLALADLSGPQPLRAQGGAGLTPAGNPQTSAALAEQAARQAAERILNAVQRRDADAYFAMLAPVAQRVSSPRMAAEAFRTMPQLRSWTIGEIAPGIDSSSVMADLQTSAGPRQVLLIVDGQGRLEGYHVNLADARAEDVVRNFMNALTQGRYITASSFLSDRLREEIPQPVLQKKWQDLQAYTGNFRSIKKITRAESNSNMKLVIVTTQFNRLTDNLFVVLDNENSIISVDFPESPELAPVSRP